MGNVGSDGKPFGREESKRLEQALFSLIQDVNAGKYSVNDAPPNMSALNTALLREWHRRLSADNPRMQPGLFRTGEIVFGSYFGTAPGKIEEELTALLDSVNGELDRLLASPEQEELAEVVRLGCMLHVGLVRIHPFIDGNGRLARVAQLWLHTLFGYAAPIFPERLPYTSALGKALRPKPDLESLIALTWAGMLL